MEDIIEKMQSRGFIKYILFIKLIEVFLEHISRCEEY